MALYKSVITNVAGHSKHSPLPREIRQSWGLQSIKYRSRDDPSLTLEGPSPIESAMRYTQSKYHAGSTSMHMRNTHYVIYFATFYLLFLLSKSCPIILKNIWCRPTTVYEGMCTFDSCADHQVCIQWRSGHQGGASETGRQHRG